MPNGNKFLKYARMVRWGCPRCFWMEFMAEKLCGEEKDL